jgi:hypothetical protein
VLFLGIEEGSTGEAILTMELPGRGNVERNQMLSLEWKEGPRVKLFLPWNCQVEGMKKGTRCCSLECEEGPRVKLF